MRARLMRYGVGCWKKRTGDGGRAARRHALAVLNLTMLSPALPAIMADLGVDATTAQWLTSVYALVEAVVIPLSAYLVGRFTTRQLFVTSLSVFTVGSLFAAIAPNFWVLLLGRIMQAACTGAVMPMVFTVILLVFPREKRGTAMGVIGLIIGFARRWGRRCRAFWLTLWAGGRCSPL